MERARSSLLFEILLGAERSQTKFVSPGIIMFHYPLIWAERCFWDLHLLQNFTGGKGAWLLSATQEKMEFCISCKTKGGFSPMGQMLR